MKSCIIVNFWANTEEKVDVVVKGIQQLRKSGKDVLYTSLTPVHPRIQEVATHCLYSDENQLINFQEVLDSTINIVPQYSLYVGDRYVKSRPINFDDVTLSVLCHLRKALVYLKQHEYDAFHYFVGDSILNDEDVNLLVNFETILEKTNKKAYFEDLTPKDFLGYQTIYFYSYIDFYLDKMPNYTRDTWIEERTTYSNLCLEELFLLKFSNCGDDVIIARQNTPYKVKVDLFRESNDALDIISTEGNNAYYVVWNDESNEFEFVVYGRKDDVANVSCENFQMNFHISQGVWQRQGLGNKPFHLTVCSKLDNFSLNVTENNISKLKNSSFFSKEDYNYIALKKSKKKIKVVHIQTTNNDEREQASRDSLERVKDYGWEYVLHQNEPYKSLPPAHNCLRPDCVSMELFDDETASRLGTALTPPHYGCFEAFKLAVLTEFHACDYLMICEGDCLIEVPIDDFIRTVEGSIPFMSTNKIGYMSFGDKALLENGWLQSPIIKEIPHQDLLYITNNIIGIQCIMFPMETASYLKEQFRTHKWDTADYFFSMMFRNSEWNMGILHKRITTQLDGYSLIDQTEKTFTK